MSHIAASALVAAVLTVRLIIGSALIYAGYRKLHDLDGARVAVLDYRLVPPLIALPMALLLGATELSVGILLALGSSFAAAQAILLLALLSAVGLVTIARGLEIDCHCADEGERLTRHALIRNAALVGGTGPGRTTTCRL